MEGQKNHVNASENVHFDKIKPSQVAFFDELVTDGESAPAPSMLLSKFDKNLAFWSLLPCGRILRQNILQLKPCFSP